MIFLITFKALAVGGWGGKVNKRMYCLHVFLTNKID